MNLIKTISTKIYIFFKYYKIFYIHKKVVSLGKRTLKKDVKKFVWVIDNEENFNNILISSLAKNLHRSKSAYILCKKGLAKDAIPLVRSIFEEFIDLKYMKLDKTRIRNFLDYDSYSRLNLGKITQENKKTTENGEIKNTKTRKRWTSKGLVEISDEEVQNRIIELQRRWNKVKHKFTYETKDGKKRVHSRWTCMGVSGVTRAVGEEELYKYIFIYLSHFIHNTTITLNEYILGFDKKQKEVILQIGNIPKFIPEVLGTFDVMFLSILDIINEENNLGFESELERLKNLLTSGKK